MPPKAAEKKPTTAGKAPAGKAPAAEKKEAGKKTAAAPSGKNKEAGKKTAVAPSGEKKKCGKTRKETYSSYISCVAHLLISKYGHRRTTESPFGLL